tara:strand:+ start:105 stop:275 length:171 start_codon:yes stop_codon:yes gene_type:complete
MMDLVEQVLELKWPGLLVVVDLVVPAHLHNLRVDMVEVVKALRIIIIPLQLVLKYN